MVYMIGQIIDLVIVWKALRALAFLFYKLYDELEAVFDDYERTFNKFYIYW